MKILCVGDLHLKEKLSYADYIEDGRQSEKEEVLKFITEQAFDCDKIVLMGDQLNARNNPSSVIKDFIKFLTSLGDKDIFILIGNHSRAADGSTALDFIDELPEWKKNWILVKDVMWRDSMVFCPYINKSLIEASDNNIASDKLIKILKRTKDANILFLHNCVSDTFSNEINVNLFSEIILDKKELESKFDLIVAGHIHNSYQGDKTILTGSVFSNSTDDKEKYIWKININKENREVQSIKIPGRKIIKLENPSNDELMEIDKNSILKVVLTKKISKEDILLLKKLLSKFDAHILLEQYPMNRKKMRFGEGESILNISLEELLKIYSKSKDIDENKLLQALELLKL